MKFLRNQLDKVKPHFEKGGKWEKFYYIYEAHETLLFAPNHTTSAKGVQIRDAIDLKRLMMTVIISMIPCLLFGIYNVGYQHFLATGEQAELLDIILVGSIQVLPIVVVSYLAGLSTEFIFATIRRHPVNEGFLVTGMLIPLVMPPAIPLWQVALATVFAVIIAKEAFGGTGMNVLNVALTARAFLYFAYPQQISGEVWTYIGDNETVAGYSGATPLAIGAETVTVGGEAVASLASFGESWAGDIYSFSNMFFGFMPGSIGETSVLMSLIGAAILIGTGVGSWKIILSVFAGAWATGFAFNLAVENTFGFLDSTVLLILSILMFVGAFLAGKYLKGELKGIPVVLLGLTGFAMLLGFTGAANEFMAMPPHYHLVMGGLAFGAVFMATDPVTACQTEMGKWYYGLLIGILTVLIRVFNPAYPEGIMLAILFMNVFAPLIDFYIVKANKERRLQRATV